MTAKRLPLILLFIAFHYFAKSQGIVQPWYVTDGGGSMGASQGLVLYNSIGQCAVQTGSSSELSLESGFVGGITGGPVFVQQLSIGWNMISIPGSVNDYRKIILYPAAASRAFAYDGRYVIRDTLRNGEGYWLKDSTLETVINVGSVISSDTVTVAARWNMIGVPSSPVRTANITTQGTTVTSNYFGYAGSYYIEDTLKPGQAYWVKVSQNGKLVLQGNGSVQQLLANPDIVEQAKAIPRAQNPLLPSSLDMVGIERLAVKDAAGREQSLYYTSQRNDLKMNVFDIPPVAPGNVLDVRFMTQRVLEAATSGEEKTFGIAIAGAVYPIHLTWDLVGQGGTSHAGIIINGKEIPIEGKKSITIEDAETPIRLRLSKEESRQLPQTFALEQNYPNPFNPATVIRYQLPVESHVTLKIYNTLGQEVRALVDEIQDAGYKSVEFDAGTLASGLYIYKLTAGSFHETRKMILLK